MMILLLLAIRAFAVTGENLELHGYMRAGVGTNSKGGNQECFYNQGTGSGGRNEFRLGNECSNYGELTFLAHQLKGKESDPFFKTQMRLAYSAPGNTSFENSESINVVEGFVEAGNLEGSPLLYWIGKKFYRSEDVHMDDFYHFTETNGNGAGVGAIPLKLGVGEFAYIKQLKDTSARSSRGAHDITLYDFRLRKMELTKSDLFSIWSAYARNPGEADGTYSKSEGELFALLYQRNFDGGFNQVMLGYGHALLAEFNLWGDALPIKGESVQNQKNGWRFVEQLTMEVNAKWALHFALSAERKDNGEKRDNKTDWMSIGTRPVYYFSDHYQLATEVGHSVIKERNTPKRELTRITIAPQISIAKNIWGRPVLRAYVTRSFWNRENRSKIAENAPAYGGSDSGGAYGFQTEVWF